MAQYIAEDPVRVVVRNEVPPVHDTKGNLVQLRQRRLYGQFRRGEAPSWTWPTALARFTFARCQVNVPKERWLSFYDSFEDQTRNGWTDEERETIEAKLDSHHSCFKVEKPRVGRPWPTYHQVKKADAVAAIATDLGLVREALAYERDRANSRPAFITALEEAAAEAAPVVEDDEVVEA